MEIVNMVTTDKFATSLVNMNSVNLQHIANISMKGRTILLKIMKRLKKLEIDSQKRETT